LDKIREELEMWGIPCIKTKLNFLRVNDGCEFDTQEYNRREVNSNTEKL
jgi:hypothetical protein